MDKISKLNSDYDVVSCFFWLATKSIGCSKEKYADCNISKERQLIKPSNINALHKSCASYAIDEELDMLPFETTFSRFHFLKFSLPNTWKSIDSSKIRLDASLGFAEQHGFRNSYGLPFRPYDFEKGKHTVLSKCR